MIPDGTFTLGSSRDDVIAVHGRPSSTLGPVWRYGRSRVRFAGRRVVGWHVHPDDPLNVAISLEDGARSERWITLGATAAEVASCLGAPEAIIGPVWRYGLSTLRFRGGEVVDIQSHPTRPLPVRVEDS